MKSIDRVEIDLRSGTGNLLTVHIDVLDNSLAHKWLLALNHLLDNNYHLEKNYCFFGFAQGPRNGELILDQVNQSISAINSVNLGYQINDHFTMDNTITDEPMGNRTLGRNIRQQKLNQLHRYFEDLQGVSGAMSAFYTAADPETRWHIRQLNLLCHEFESWALSYRKELEAPAWCRPSQLMCWLHAPRFELDSDDYELFGVETISRSTGGVFIGVNKAVGKHHWEVFHDEGRDSRIGELVTSTLRSQTEAAGDFDIEWGQNPAGHPWQEKELADFRSWLAANGFDPTNKALTIGHPQVAQVNLMSSFGTEDLPTIWQQLNTHLDVYQIRTNQACATYNYHWSDADFKQRQVNIINQGHSNELDKKNI